MSTSEETRSLQTELEAKNKEIEELRQRIRDITIQRDAAKSSLERNEKYLEAMIKGTTRSQNEAIKHAQKAERLEADVQKMRAELVKISLLAADFLKGTLEMSLPEESK
jgi:chromosome segregation ATPase